jgi:hypothetical protein
MRSFILFTLLLAGCSQEVDEPPLKTGNFAGQGRDRLCIAGEAGAYRAGLIAFGGGDVNCSIAGRLESAGANWRLTPKGEGACQIPLEIQGDIVRVGQVPSSCAYYCGPGATLAGKSFSRSEMASKAVDFAGDPLC